MTTKTKQPANNDCGYANGIWAQAKKQALRALRRIAREERTIYYSELVQEIHAIQFEYHGVPLNHLLAEISEDENEAGRGMLSVVCVCKDSNARSKRGQTPGDGFYIWARYLGYEVSTSAEQEMEFWVWMLRLVYEKNAPVSRGRS